MPAGRLHAFGASFSIDEAFVVLAAVLFLTALLLLVTLVLGRVWCGWGCPQTVLAPRLRARILDRRRRGARRGPGAAGRLLRQAGDHVLLGLASGLVAANLLWYFVSPYAFFRRLLAGALGPVLGWSWIGLAAVLFVDLAFIGETFCATVCPYAKLQGVLFDRATLAVAYDARRAADCVQCGACVRVCPTGIDIRDGLQTECIACAACIDACAPIMARLGRPGNLVGYFFGEPGARRRLLRPGALALAGATAATLALLGGVVAGRDLLAVTALSDDAFTPRRTADGRVVNAYQVALENRRRAGVTVDLALRAGAGEVTLRPERVALGPGERREVRVVASARGLDAPGRRPAELVGEARAGDRLVDRVGETVPFTVPEAR